MASLQPDRMSGNVAPAYVRHKPEQTLLYQLVEQYWPEFQTQLSETGRFLPRHVMREFEEYLACGRLENGFLRVRCQSCSHEHLAWAAPWVQLQTTWLLWGRLRSSCGARRMVETAALLVERGPVQTIPAWQEDDYGTDQLGRIGGFSLHAGVAVNTRERKKLERICRGGPAGISLAPRYRKARLELTDQGMVSYVGAAFRLKTAYLRGPIGMGLRMWCSSGAAFRRWIGTRSLYGQTGSAGAQASNESHTISWSIVTGRPSVEQSLPRKRDAAKCPPGKTCHR